MIRFKVIKGSHVLLIISIVILLVVLAAAAIGTTNRHSKSYDITETSSASAVAVVANADAYALQVKIIADKDVSTTENHAPSVLIYHTHTHEAYQQDEGNPYEAIETWRTTDTAHSVVRVGTALADKLREKGLNVIHDTTDHELDDINNSYVRSLETLKTYSRNFDLIIDLHRDAYSNGLLPRLQTTDGSNYAQVMFLIGQGNNYPPEQRPDYKTNLSFAQEVTRRMNNKLQNICRNVTVKDGRYNQHIGNTAVLVEVGHNLNTLQEALASIPYLADAIYDSLK